MPISQMPELFNDILDPDPAKRIPPEILAYFRRRLRLQLHELVTEKFYQQEVMTQADLASRIGKRPEVVNRLLGAPGNWTLDTVSDLLIALRALPAIGIDNIKDMLNKTVDVAAKDQPEPPDTSTVSVEISGPQSMHAAIELPSAEDEPESTKQ
jgi:hypothetical protein